jgi:hypothetical protein
MGHVTQTSTRPAGASQAHPAAVPVGSAEGAAQAGAAGRTTWIIRPGVAFSAEALRERLIGSVRSWRDYPPSLRLWFWCRC